MNRIYLIRHGKTEANLKHLYCGSTDLPLSPEGRELLAGLSYPVCKARYVTSGMKRTEQTLLCLFGEVAHEQDPRFREVDFGEFEMKSYEQLKENPAYLQWISGENEKNIPPRGESGEQMKRRVLDGFRELSMCGEDVVLITHGGVIAAVMEAVFPGEGKNRYRWQPEPGHGYCISGNSYAVIP